MYKHTKFDSDWLKAGGDMDVFTDPKFTWIQKLGVVFLSLA